ncbi:MAG: AAA family ATPase [Isosphaeraceae bacterium]
MDEPAEDVAVRMIRGIVPTWEKHHKVRILEEAVRSAVKLSARYITGRQLPDKAISLVDTTSARVAISQNAQPAAIEDAVRRIQGLDHELAMLDREGRTASVDAEHVESLKAGKAEAEAELAELNRRWEQEKALAQEIWKLRDRIESAASDVGSAAARESLDSKVAELRELQGESPLITLCVDAQAIAEVVSGWTGIPVGKMQSDEIQTLLHLEERLGRRVVGQGQALEAICQRIQTSRAGLTDPRRPIGVFLLVGPSGVGKTETALTLADTIYGGERNLITINMSEYQEKHTVSSLKGSPPGYVGYGEGGVLTEAVRRKPYSVVLLDEIEKAHPDVHEVFFQVFDKGMLEDGEGREIDFKNTVIILTSNVGTDTIAELCKDPAKLPDPADLAERLKPDLLDAFQPAFLGRLVVVPYYPISDAIMKQIARLQLDRIGDRLRREHKARLEYTEALVEQIAARCTDVSSGARNVDHILTRSLLPAVSAQILDRMSRSESFRRVGVDVDPQGQFLYTLD